MSPYRYDSEVSSHDADASRRTRGGWLGLAVGVLVIGILGSLLGAHIVASEDARSSQQAFSTASGDVASRLQLALQREQDLVIAAGGFAIRNPEGSQASFEAWTASVLAFQRYPEVQGIAELTLVPASQLGAFAARMVADPAGALGPGGTFVVTPAGTRPYYCFQSAAQSRTKAGSVPAAGFDYCDTALGPALLKARSSGQSAYLPYPQGAVSVLVLGTAVYRGGVTPTTEQGRLDAFIGWTGTSIVPKVLLTTAIAGHPGMSVSFRHGAGASAVSFTAGSSPKGSQSATLNLTNGWHVQTRGLVKGGTILDNSNALAVLVAGSVIAVLMALLIYLLTTSRSRAMVLVTERTDQLHHQAFHDSLTGLPNRALILDRISQMMARSRREGTPVAALFLDIDDFKEVNDTLGHDAGDQLLFGMAARLSKALREGDTVGRLGGDEFVVLAEGVSLAAGPLVVADRILDILATPFEIAASDTPLTVSSSIGVAIGERATPEELLRDADVALYRAKTSGKRHAVVFSSSMQDAVTSHRSLEFDLRQGMANGQFFLLYQPTVDLATGVFTGAEALLRWNRPGQGIVQPVDFIPSLESTGLITSVGAWVLHEACRQGAAWQREGRHLTVSVNISARQLEVDGIVGDLQDALTASGINPGMVILELTETTLMHDVKETIRRLEALKRTGVRIAIDDFGTGYSSLAYLQQFPIDVLKIDQSFVSEMSKTAESAAIVHALVQLGKVLGLETIAEGIETDDQRTLLCAEEVDNGQGFLFARPISAEAVGLLLDGSVARVSTPSS